MKNQNQVSYSAQIVSSFRIASAFQWKIGNLCEFRNLNQTVRSSGFNAHSTLNKWHFSNEDFLYGEVSIDATPARDFNNPNSIDMAVGVVQADKVVNGVNPFNSEFGWGIATSNGNRLNVKFGAGNG
jgi:hypothetical protein